MNVKKRPFLRITSDLDPDQISGKTAVIRSYFADIKKDEVRNNVLASKKRIDGRSYDEIRPICCEVGLLPRTHGSAMFTRGETQGLVSVTLGTGEDEQKIDSLTGETFRKFMLHYNFPPFSVGEALCCEVHLAEKLVMALWRNVL